MLKRDMLYLLSQPSTPDKIDFRTKAITRVVSFLFPSAGLAPRRKQFLTAVAQTDLWGNSSRHSPYGAKRRLLMFSLPHSLCIKMNIYAIMIQGSLPLRSHCKYSFTPMRCWVFEILLPTDLPTTGAGHLWFRNCKPRWLCVDRRLTAKHSSI